MTLVLDAVKVAAEDLEGSWVVGFADREPEPKRYLVLRRPFQGPREPYYVVLGDQGRSCHGGIERFELHRDRALVSFSPHGEKHLGVSAARIRFSIGDELHARVHERLTRIFEGTSIYVRG